MKNKSKETIFVLTGQEEENDPLEWYDMPAYYQPYKDPYDEVRVLLKTKEDLDAFAKLLGQPNVAKKGVRRGFTWFPEKDKFRNTAVRWIHKEQLDKFDVEIISIEDLD